MRILIIGYGSIAKKHEKVIREIIPNVEIYALRTSSMSPTVKDVTNIFTYGDLQKVNPDFFIVSNATIAHATTLKKILPFEKPIFIEKPSLHNLQDAEGLIRTIKKKNIITYVACNLRFLDCIEFIKSYLEKYTHVINEVNVYAGSYLPAWRPNTDFREVYSANTKLGGGVHLDLIHELDYLYWIFGHPLKTQHLLKNNSSLKIDAIDYANYHLIYKCFVANVTLNYYRRDTKRTFEIVFEKETWLIDLIKNHIISSTGEVIFTSSQTILDTYYYQMKYFITSLQKNDKESLNSFMDSIEVLKIALRND